MPDARDDVYLSVVIPAYNEAGRILPTLRDVAGFLAKKRYASEIIVVDDGSTDATVEIVRNCQGVIPHLTLLNGEHNHGKGHAVHRGMMHASGLWRLFMDADNSVKISNVDRFLWHGNEGYDVVIGSIAPNAGAEVVEHNGWHRRILGSAATSLIRLCATPDIHDTQRGFKLFSRRAAEDIFEEQTIERFGFDIELLVIAEAHGFRIKEMPVRWDNPGGSSVHAGDYLRTLRDLGEITRNRLAHRYG